MLGVCFNCKRRESEKECVCVCVCVLLQRYMQLADEATMLSVENKDSAKTGNKDAKLLSEVAELRQKNNLLQEQVR